MSEEDGKALIRRYYGELWNQWDFELIDVLLTADIRFRGSLGARVEGVEDFRQYMDLVRGAFPDFHNTIDDIIAENDKIAVRLTYQGTHEGKLFDIPPTGRRVRYAGSGIFRISGNRIAEGWVLGETLGLLEQVGALRS